MGKLTHFEYCTKVCGAKCCYLRTKEEGVVPCPNLKGDSSCSVYEKRYAEGTADLVVVGTYRSKVVKDLEGNAAERHFFCGRVPQLLEQGTIAPNIAAQCCYAHPELLETQGQ